MGVPSVYVPPLTATGQTASTRFGKIRPASVVSIMPAVGWAEVTSQLSDAVSPVTAWSAENRTTDCPPAATVPAAQPCWVVAGVAATAVPATAASDFCPPSSRARLAS